MADPERLQELQLEIQILEQWSFQSPILPPAILKQYAELIPNFAERYYSNWENQTAHRQALETKVVETQSKTQLRAQHYAFMLGALVLVVALVLGLNDQEVAAVAVVSLDFIGLGGMFIFGKVSNLKEARRKSEVVPDPSAPRPAKPRAELPKARPTQPNPNRSKKRRKR